jgi:DNA (cytosine-5)-methyltransferase 1
MSSRRPEEILNAALAKAISELEKNVGKDFLKNLTNEESQWINTIVKNAPSQKGVMSVLITSLVKKIETPSQDIRLHQSKMEGGYSGRTLDTEIVTPFLHRHFQKYSMKESGWLTRSLEQPRPFTLDFQGEIRNKEVKNAFLQILHSIQERHAEPEKYLVALFIHLEMEKRRIQTQLMKIPKVSTGYPIGIIVDLLKEHFNGDYHSYGASKLPVLAIYSLYQIMINELARFKSKKLLPLKSHVTADVKAKSLGDVEIVDENGDFFEVVEIKLGISISYDMVDTIYDEKIKNTKVNRYYVLTSAEPFLVEEEKDDIAGLVYQIRKEHGCEIIINGLIPSIRYYLRLIGSTKDFLDKYNENLKLEINTSSEIKEEHLQAWIQLLGKLTC